MYEERWLWWPIRFLWASKSGWFMRHGIEAFVRTRIVRDPQTLFSYPKPTRYTVQVWHFGRLRVKLGRERHA